MVTSITSTPYYSYLSQLQGTAIPTPSTAVSGSASGSASQSASSSLVSSLIGTSGFSPSVLSLLQESGSGQFDPIANILGGQSSGNGTAKLLANLYSSAAASSLQSAQIGAAKKAIPSSGAQALINNSLAASTAYNQTLQQNAAAAVKASESRTSSITSLVS